MESWGLVTGVHYSMSMQTYLYVDMYGERAKYIDLQYGSKTNISSGHFGSDLAVEELGWTAQNGKNMAPGILLYSDFLRFAEIPLFGDL